MRKLVIAVAALATLVVADVVALYAYDASRSDVIAPGVTVAGVNVGGMSARQARVVLERDVMPRAERPVLVEYGDATFVLSIGEAEIDADIEGMVEAAVEESRNGNFAARAVRDLFQRDVDTDVPLQVTYSREAVHAFVAHVDRAVSRRARDAKVIPSPTDVRLVRSRNGIDVRARELESAILAGLETLDGERTIELPTRVTKPKVSTAELRRRHRYFITISRAQKTLRLYRRLKLVKVYTVAIGAAGFDTPAGLHRIRNKAVNPAWFVPNKPWAGDLAGKVIPPGSPDNPIAARWMGFYDGAGIHGTEDTSSIGTAASHGCIRMTIPDVVELYDRVPIGTRLYIA